MRYSIEYLSSKLLDCGSRIFYEFMLPASYTASAVSISVQLTVCKDSSLKRLGVFEWEVVYCCDWQLLLFVVQSVCVQ